MKLDSAAPDPEEWITSAPPATVVEMVAAEVDRHTTEHVRLLRSGIERHVAGALRIGQLIHELVTAAEDCQRRLAAPTDPAAQEGLATARSFTERVVEANDQIACYLQDTDRLSQTITAALRRSEIIKVALSHLCESLRQRASVDPETLQALVRVAVSFAESRSVGTDAGTRLMLESDFDSGEFNFL